MDPLNIYVTNTGLWTCRVLLLLGLSWIFAQEFLSNPNNSPSDLSSVKLLLIFQILPYLQLCNVNSLNSYKKHNAIWAPKQFDLWKYWKSTSSSLHCKELGHVTEFSSGKWSEVIKVIYNPSHKTYAWLYIFCFCLCSYKWRIKDDKTVSWKQPWLLVYHLGESCIEVSPNHTEIYWVKSKFVLSPRY